MKQLFLLLPAVGILAVTTDVPAADARVDSWLTSLSGRYARIYESAAAQTAGTTVTTWTRGATSQSLPAYSGVSEISYSTDWVYIRTSGLGFHVMGPWYLDVAKTQNFPAFPVNKKAIFRLPRVTSVPATKTKTSAGAIGYFVDGVAMFDMQDTYSWNGSTEAVNGSGIWNRDAYVVEGVTFDPGNAHQPGDGQYHYHANPPALRYLLDDNVDYNALTKTYSEKATAPTKHSPIIGWVKDGYPIYGPYGYSSALDTSSGVRRMISGYVLRNGSNGTVNLSSTGRTTLPLWAQRAQNRTTLSAGQYGPNVSTTYTLGRYHEDKDYLGDLGKTPGVDFDLDEYNGRYCKTPEFPSGTYAYFLAIEANGTPAFPYNIGRTYYGNPNGGEVASITETVTTNWVGAANATLKLAAPTVNGTTVTLVWSATEGGTYRVESKDDVGTAGWTTLSSSVSSVKNTGTYTNITGATARFYQVTRTALASYDGGDTGGGGGGGGGTVTFNATFSTNPPLPPQNAIEAAAVGGVTATITSYNQATGAVTLQFNNSALAAGNYTASLKFTPPGMTQQTVTSTNQYTKN